MAYAEILEGDGGVSTGVFDLRDNTMGFSWFFWGKRNASKCGFESLRLVDEGNDCLLGVFAG